MQIINFFERAIPSELLWEKLHSRKHAVKKQTHGGLYIRVAREQMWWPITPIVMFLKNPSVIILLFL